MNEARGRPRGFFHPPRSYAGGGGGGTSPRAMEGAMMTV
jgi:hypothetical protein